MKRAVELQWVLNYWDDRVQKKFPNNWNQNNQWIQFPRLLEIPQNNRIFISNNSILAMYYVAKIWAKNRICKNTQKTNYWVPGTHQYYKLQIYSSYAWALWNYTPCIFHFLVFSCLDCLCLFSWTFDSNALSLISFHFIWCKEFFQIVSCILFVVYIFRIFLFFLLVCLQIMLALKNYSLKSKFWRVLLNCTH